MLQNVLAMQENALVGAKKVGQEKNAIKVILHCFTCSKASFSKRGRGGGGVYMFIFKIRLRFIILKFCLSPNHSVTYLGFFSDLVYCRYVSRHKISDVWLCRKNDVFILCCKSSMLLNNGILGDILTHQLFYKTGRIYS